MNGGGGVPNKHWEGGGGWKKNQKINKQGRRLFGIQEYCLMLLMFPLTQSNYIWYK